MSGATFLKHVTMNAVDDQEAASLNASATHESGHTFLRWRLGYEIAFAQIGEKLADCFVRSRQGALQFGQKELANLKYDLDRLICACSGYAAESVTGICDESEWLSSKDRHRGLEAAKRLSDGDGEAAELLIEWGRRMAFLILSAHQAKVQRLTDALLAHRRLTGEAISDLLGNNGSRER
jgi:hypothetical protein